MPLCRPRSGDQANRLHMSAAARTEVGRAFRLLAFVVPGRCGACNSKQLSARACRHGGGWRGRHNGGCDEPVGQCVQQEAADKFVGRHTSRIRHSYLFLRRFPADISFGLLLRSLFCSSQLRVSARTILSGDRSLGENQACLTARFSRSRIDRDQED